MNIALIVEDNWVDIFKRDHKISLLKDTFQNSLETASRMEVSSEDSAKQMTDFYADAKQWEKKIDSLRKESNAPEQEKINIRNAKSAELVAPLKEIQLIAKKKCDVYQAFVREEKRKEEELSRCAFYFLDADETQIIPLREKSVNTGKALMFTRTVRKFRITDIDQVPRKYLKVDEKSIDQAINLGINEIPGIEIYEEQVTQLRTR